MAEMDQQERSTEDLSDEASPYRVEEHRKRGQVAQSRELSGIIGLVFVGVVMMIYVPTIADDVSRFAQSVFQADLMLKLRTDENDFMLGALRLASAVMLKTFLPIALIAAVIGILSSLFQVGAIFSLDPITPQWSRINPISAFKKYFSVKFLIDGTRLIIRATALVIVAFVLVRTIVSGSPRYVFADPIQLGRSFMESGRTLWMGLGALLLVFAVIDFWVQRWEYGKQVRLTKQEAKQEHKEHEGDPLIKARIRSVQKEMARRRMMEAVKTAEVIVTNPTHIAVALSYDRDKMNAPKVVAKGADFMAQKIKKIAADAGVPLVENVPLARALFKQVKLGRTVPRALYQAVAEVLAYVYRLKNKVMRRET